MKTSYAPVVAVAGALPVEAGEPSGNDFRSRYLFGPIVDLLCLGGGSLLVLPVVALLLTNDWKPAVAAAAILLSVVINHPHFANSYQIFYRDFRRKAFGHGYPPLLQARYVVAGVGVPAALALFLALCVVSGDSRMLGFGGNIMLFFVGWHYAKQGYGIIVLESVMKRQFFTDAEKQALLVNAYACWMASWVVANATMTERSVWGVTYYMFSVPAGLLYTALAVAAITTVRMLAMLAGRALIRGGRLPLNGVLAYVVTLYVWLVFALALGPIALLVIPAFHSLQYLVVVWRYQLNSEKGRQITGSQPEGGASGRPGRRLGRFILMSIALGFLGFWGLPLALDSAVPYDRATFGGTMFLFCFHIFINVHHYFLDSVIWRRENPETRQHLLG